MSKDLVKDLQKIHESTKIGIINKIENCKKEILDALDYYKEELAQNDGILPESFEDAEADIIQGVRVLTDIILKDGRLDEKKKKDKCLESFRGSFPIVMKRASDNKLVVIYKNMMEWYRLDSVDRNIDGYKDAKMCAENGFRKVDAHGRDNDWLVS